MHGDIVAAARVLYDAPQAARPLILDRLLSQAERADIYRRSEGAIHPFWGDGSLMAVALRKRPPPEPPLEDTEYCACLAQVFDALVNRVRKSRRLGLLGRAQGA
ncbi:DUF7742 family protein [Candidatus Rhodobacter oscarellae]